MLEALGMGTKWMSQERSKTCLNLPGKKKRCLDLAIKLVSFSCFSKNICFYFKQILENYAELMSNNCKICCLV